MLGYIRPHDVGLHVLGDDCWNGFGGHASMLMRHEGISPCIHAQTAGQHKTFSTPQASKLNSETLHVFVLSFEAFIKRIASSKSCLSFARLICSRAWVACAIFGHLQGFGTKVRAGYYNRMSSKVDRQLPRQACMACIDAEVYSAGTGQGLFLAVASRVLMPAALSSGCLRL